MVCEGLHRRDRQGGSQGADLAEHIKIATYHESFHSWLGLYDLG